MKHASGTQRIQGQRARRGLPLAAITLLLLAAVVRTSAGDFINLTFDDAHVTPEDIASGGNTTGSLDRLLPGWQVFTSDTQPYTGLIQWGQPHEGMPFALFPSPWSNVSPDAPTLYALFIDTRLLPSTFSDPGYNIVHLRQTGTIPSSAQTLEYVPNLTLRINGVGVSTGPGGADVRPWAGQQVTLDFSNLDWTSGGIIPTTAAFDIFGFYPIPEPSTRALLAVGLGALVWSMRRRSSGQAACPNRLRSLQPIGLARGEPRATMRSVSFKSWRMWRASAALMLLLALPVVRGGDFVNLGFENLNENAVGNQSDWTSGNLTPSWEWNVGGKGYTFGQSIEVDSAGGVLEGYTGGSGVLITRANGFNFPVVGQYGVFLSPSYNGITFSPTSIRQSGTVPPGTRSLQFFDYYYRVNSMMPPVDVSINGISLPVESLLISSAPLAQEASISIYTYRSIVDVSRYSGQAVSLEFSFPLLPMGLDDIRFSTLPIPEPSTRALLAFGFCGVFWSLRRRKAVA